MVRAYKITWYETKDTKYGGEPNIRTTKLALSKPVGYTPYDAKCALGIFISANGNLNKNTVLKIQEFDENGQIGEDIVPSAEADAIIPVARK